MSEAKLPINLPAYLKHQGLDDWPKADAVVTHWSMPAPADDQKAISIKPSIQLRYEVEGTEYTTDRFALQNVTVRDYGTWALLDQRYAVGKTTEVSYKPSDPAVAYADLSLVAYRPLTGLLMTGGIAWFGIILLCYMMMQSGKIREIDEAIAGAEEPSSRPLAASA